MRIGWVFGLPYHVFACDTEKQGRCWPFRPKQNDKQIGDEVIENDPVFSFIRVPGLLSFAGSMDHVVVQ